MAPEPALPHPIEQPDVPAPVPLPLLPLRCPWTIPQRVPLVLIRRIEGRSDVRGARIDVFATFVGAEQPQSGLLQVVILVFLPRTATCTVAWGWNGRSWIATGNLPAELEPRALDPQPGEQSCRGWELVLVFLPNTATCTAA